MSSQVDALQLSAAVASSNDARITRPSADSTSAISTERPQNSNDIAGNSAAFQPVPLPEPPAAAQKLPRATVALTMTSLCLSALLSALDLTIVTTAIPAIVGSFKSTAGYIWIGSAFILAQTAITPVWGSVADIWGRKPIMLIAVAIFLAGTLLCGLAPDMNTLIAGRAVQGAGTSGMSIMVNVVISDMFSLRERGLYLAITSIVWAIGSSVGPILGGVFTTRLNWRWCFWVNLPIGAAVFVILVFFMRVPTPNTPVLAGLRAIDWSGSLLIVSGALMALLGLDFGDITHPWSSATVICLIVFGAVTIGIFIVNEWKIAKNPVIPLHLFSTTSTAAAFCLFACNSYVFIGLAYYLPLYSQSVLGANALTSGLYLLPLIVSTSLAAAFAGVIIQQTGKYLPLMYVAQTLLTLGVGLFIDLGFEINLTKLFIFEILVGVGVGMNIEAPITAAQAATTVRDTAAVIATMSFVRSISTAISIVIGGVVFQNKMNVANAQLIGELGPQLAAQFNGSQASASIELLGALPTNQQMLVRQVYFGALRTVWIMYVAFAGVASILSLFVRAHYLSRENIGAVLGVNRANEDIEPPGSLPRGDSVELLDVQDDTAQS